MKGIQRGAGMILILTVIARITGFARYLVFGGTVGGGEIGTAYATANLLPNVLFEIAAGGALAAMVVPLVAGLVGRAETEDLAGRIVSALLGWTLLVTILLAALVALCAGPIAQVLLGAGAAPSMVDVGTALLRIFAIQLPLYAITVVLGAYLQARKRFLWPALVPLISSLVVVASYIVYAALVPASAGAAALDARGLWVLGGGTTAGVLAMALPVTLAAMRAGYRPRVTLKMPPEHAGQAGRLGAAGLGAVLAQQGVIALIMLLAMRAGGTGTLVLFQYAQAVYLLPYAVLVVPLMTAVFPRLSELRLIADTVEFARVASSSLRIVMAVSLMGSSALIAAAPAVDQFFRELDRASLSGVGPVLAALALGLGGYAISMHSTKILSAALRARDALLVGSIGWVVAAVLIAVTTMLSSQRQAAAAATTFALAIALGMGTAAVMGLARVEPLIASGGDQDLIRRLAVLGPMILLVGVVPGHLLVRALLDADSGIALVVLSGIVSGAVAALLSGAMAALIDREALARVRDRLSRRSTPADGDRPSSSPTAPRGEVGA